MPILRTSAELTGRIVALESRIERLGTDRHPGTKRLRQVDGVGPITSLAFVLTLEDPRRYRTSRAVGAYLVRRPPGRR